MIRLVGKKTLPSSPASTVCKSHTLSINTSGATTIPRVSQSSSFCDTSDGASTVLTSKRFSSSDLPSLVPNSRLEMRRSSAPVILRQSENCSLFGSMEHLNSIRRSSSTPPVSIEYDMQVLSSTGTTSDIPLRLSSGLGFLKGCRPTMEDNHFSIIHGTEVKKEPVSMFGVLDGHAGKKVADLGSKLIPEHFFAHHKLGSNTAQALVESIISTDQKIFEIIGKDDGGSTLITAVIHNRCLYVACVGDARAVLYEANGCSGVTTAMSLDHKPNDTRELQRIKRCGGFVRFGRVNGCLAVSRALGDFDLKFKGNNYVPNKEFPVSNVADIKQINITDSSRFLVLACDGLWDVVKNEEATKFVVDYLKKCPVPKHRNTPAPASTAHDGGIPSSSMELKLYLDQCALQLAVYAIQKGSTDNVSVMIIAFHNDLINDI